MAMRRRKKGGSKLLMIGAMMTAIMIAPTTIMLGIGMLPTIVAYFMNKRRNKIRTLTIGAMNLAGCMPYVYELWLGGHDFNISVQIVMDPQVIIIMYAAAGLGYVIDWAVSGFVSVMLYEKGQARAREVEKLRDGLVDRWGEKVTGKIPLDSRGFPLDADMDMDRTPKNENKI